MIERLFCNLYQTSMGTFLFLGIKPVWVIVIASAFAIGAFIALLCFLDDIKKHFWRKRYPKSFYAKETGITLEQIENRNKGNGAGFAGAMAEYELTELLIKRYGNKAGYFAGAIFKSPETGKLTEIDAVAVTSAGVLVFECKGYTGYISGSLDVNNWDQEVIKFNGTVNKQFFNPVKQNAGHIAYLKDNLRAKGIRFYSIVVFSDKAEGVNLSGDLHKGTYVVGMSKKTGGIRHIKAVLDEIDRNVMLKNEDVKMLAKMIDNARLHGIEAREEHIRMMQQRAENGEFEV